MELKIVVTADAELAQFLKAMEDHRHAERLRRALDPDKKAE